MPLPIVPLAYAGIAALAGYGIIQAAEAGKVKSFEQVKQTGMAVAAAGAGAVVAGSVFPFGAAAWMLRAAGVGAAVTGVNIWATADRFESRLGMAGKAAEQLVDGLDADSFLAPPPGASAVEDAFELPPDRRSLWSR